MGIRGRGRGLALGFAGQKDVRITHLCDVDSNLLPSLAQAIGQKQESEPKLEKDVRRVLDDRSVDALVVATPDHWHALATVWACQAGKHVYVEKPASHDVWEGPQDGRGGPQVRPRRPARHPEPQRPALPDMVDFLRAGKLGRSTWPRPEQPAPRVDRQEEDGPVPPGVDYDLWLGPAPERPFNVNRFHSTWHWNWDYGTGDMGNDGVHDLDIARWGLGVSRRRPSPPPAASWSTTTTRRCRIPRS
jgi:hypothetical protein